MFGVSVFSFYDVDIWNCSNNVVFFDKCENISMLHSNENIDIYFVPGRRVFGIAFTIETKY